jgi:hypothetical protein
MVGLREEEAGSSIYTTPFLRSNATKRKPAPAEAGWVDKAYGKNELVG